MTLRLTARGRLAILYTGLVLAAGIVMAALMYILMSQSLARRQLFIQTLPTSAPAPVPTETPQMRAIAERLRAETLAELTTQAAIALVVVTLLAAVLGWLVAGRVLRPIRAISATAQRLSAENLSERVPVNTPADELAALADTINGMLDRVQRGIAERDQVLDSQRMFTANAAHELRTPLTTMRTAIDVTLDGDPSTAELLAMADDVRTAVEHSQQTLDGLLQLARSQAGPGEQHPVDLAAVVAGILTKATDTAITPTTDLRPAPISGEPILLERMAGNLFDNAVRYNDVGGHIEVTTGIQDTSAFLRIANSGRKIMPDKANGLLEPFVRGEGNRTRSDGGAGLGLSIVRAIVVAHRGEITTIARPAGGLDITVRFPAT